MQIKIYQATWSATTPPYRVQSTEITGIKAGTFHYHASMEENGNYRATGVFSSYIEFEYYSDNGIVLSKGDDILCKKVVTGGQDFTPDTYQHEVSIQYFNVFSITKKAKTYHIVAYDDTALLDVDFSATLKANQSNFPMSMLDLMNLASNTAGVEIPFNSGWVGRTDAFGNPLHNWINTTVQYFYADGITVRDVVKWAAELSNAVLIVPTVSLNTTKRVALHTFAAVGQAMGYNLSNRYIVAPGDGTYNHPNIPVNDPAIVWYTEDGLELKDGFSAFDGVEIVSSTGEMLASYYDSLTLDTVYQISGNLLADNIISFDSGYSFNGVAKEVLESANYLSTLGNAKNGTVRIFPFRNPFANGLNLYGVDEDGNYFRFPIMSIDQSDRDCVLGSYDFSSVDNIYNKKVVNQKESLSAAWAKITAFESEIGNIGISGGCLTPAIKAALLQLAEKVAYIDNQGQDYYQDLCDALYPLSELASISAVFTQGQTVVYDTDSLDSLKSMLVVTATYEDSSTRTVPSSAYTLSGTLTVGASTITASYGGKTDTFTVTVTEGTLYPLYNGSHSFNYDRSVVVTDGNHFEFTDVGSYTSAFANYINITDVRNNNSAPDSTNNINNQPSAFTIPAGATVTLELKNISATRPSGSSTWSFGVRGTGTTTISGLSITNLGPNPSDKSVTVTIANSTDVGCVFFYARNYSQIAGDVSMTVNGVRYI